MQIANNDMAAKTSTEGRVNGGNGNHGGRIALQELPVLGTATSPRKAWTAAPLSLPVPPFPRHPEKCGNVEPDPKLLPRDGNPLPDERYPADDPPAMRGWLFPYLKSRVMPGDFHPIIAYLFTEWKCNLDCHYCWAFDNSVKGMTEDVAKRSIDWLHGTTCRVLALMGGEPLLRPDFAHKIVYYAAKSGFWVYVPTNGRLMRPEVIDRLADAGVATVQSRGGCGGREARAAQGAESDPAIFRLSGAQAVRLRLHGFLQHQHLPEQPGGRQAADRNRPRQRHRHRLPHQRIAHDRAAALQAHGREQHLHHAGGLAAGGRSWSTG